MSLELVDVDNTVRLEDRLKRSGMLKQLIIPYIFIFKICSRFAVNHC